MNIEVIKKAIDETYRRTGGREPAKLICGQKLFHDLCDCGMIDYNVHEMVAKFYGIPIFSVHNTALLEDDKIIVVPEILDSMDYGTDYYEWLNEQICDPLGNVNDDVSISEEELLKILNGGGRHGCSVSSG